MQPVYDLVAPYLWSVIRLFWFQYKLLYRSCDPYFWCQLQYVLPTYLLYILLLTYYYYLLTYLLTYLLYIQLLTYYKYLLTTITYLPQLLTYHNYLLTTITYLLQLLTYYYYYIYYYYLLTYLLLLLLTYLLTTTIAYLLTYYCYCLLTCLLTYYYYLLYLPLLTYYYYLLYLPLLTYYYYLLTTITYMYLELVTELISNICRHQNQNKSFMRHVGLMILGGWQGDIHVVSTLADMGKKRLTTWMRLIKGKNRSKEWQRLTRMTPIEMRLLTTQFKGMCRHLLFFNRNSGIKEVKKFLQYHCWHCNFCLPALKFSLTRFTTTDFQVISFY